jgi:hypothetical protein
MWRPVAPEAGSFAGGPPVSGIHARSERRAKIRPDGTKAGVPFPCAGAGGRHPSRTPLFPSPLVARTSL